jgi:hypothetical protein
MSGKAIGPWEEQMKTIKPLRQASFAVVSYRLKTMAKHRCFARRKYFDREDNAVPMVSIELLPGKHVPFTMPRMRGSKIYAVLK